MAPNLTYEQELHAQGLALIAGVDEAGRGCWAGPVVAAAAILSPAVLADPGLLAGVDDSKQMSATLREQSYDRIAAHTTAAGVGIVPAYLIDAYGIIAATRLAMTIALLSLRCAPDGLLIDALPLPQLAIPQTVLIKGDARSLSIAAASVLAKVTRDRLMQTAHAAMPAYGFAMHKGYGTALHQRALQHHGPSSLHRHTFKPLIQLAFQQEALAPSQIPV